jgi:ubiquinone/menaquinone biosynthesis C-methylase UbiE
MLPRVLEAEVMDIWAESTAYDAMDFTAVNSDFVRTAAQLHPQAVKVLDLGTGPGQIPILLCGALPACRVWAIDLAQTMVILARRNIEAAGLLQRVTLAQADGKGLPYPNWEFDLVVCNSLVHHIPQPLTLFKEIARLVTPQGAILIRDLLRPESEEELEAIAVAAGDFDHRQGQLLRDSLRAALTLGEVQELLAAVNLPTSSLAQTSERHWTVAIPARSIFNTSKQSSPPPKDWLN